MLLVVLENVIFNDHLVIYLITNHILFNQFLRLDVYRAFFQRARTTTSRNKATATHDITSPLHANQGRVTARPPPPSPAGLETLSSKSDFDGRSPSSSAV